METVATSKLKLKGFFQGAELGADGQPGALGSYISLQKEDTGEVLNVVVPDEEMTRILNFVYQPVDAAGDSGASETEPEAEAPAEEPQEPEPTPTPFPS